MFDADGIDGNGNDYNILVGEPVYGANWWLTNGSSADAKAADPSGANDGGNGSAYFGTLAEWKTALPNARVYAGGFSLGSGVKGDGVIDSITYGATTYRFTKTTPEVKTVRNVHGTSSIVRRPHGVRVDLRSELQPANTVLGKKLHWVVKVDGRVGPERPRGLRRPRRAPPALRHRVRQAPDRDPQERRRGSQPGRQVLTPPSPRRAPTAGRGSFDSRAVGRARRVDGPCGIADCAQPVTLRSAWSRR